MGKTSKKGSSPRPDQYVVKHIRGEDFAPRDPNPLETWYIDQHMIYLCFRAALARMTTWQKFLFIVCNFYGVRNRELAEATGLTDGGVSYHKRKAEKIFQEVAYDIFTRD